MYNTIEFAMLFHPQLSLHTRHAVMQCRLHCFACHEARGGGRSHIEYSFVEHVLTAPIYLYKPAVRRLVSRNSLRLGTRRTHASNRAATFAGAADRGHTF